MQYPEYRDAWSAFHDGRLTNDRAEDARDIQRGCDHDMKPADQATLRCTKCGFWNYKESR